MFRAAMPTSNITNVMCVGNSRMNAAIIYPHTSKGTVGALWPLSAGYNSARAGPAVIDHMGIGV